MIANQTPGKPPIRFLSVCSGIEAASQALIPLGGFECGAVSEIDPFPCHVLAQRYGATRPRFMPDPDEPWIKPKEAKHRADAIKAVSTLPLEGDIPNLGDMSRFMEWPDAEFDALFGGTPCQSFSIAGLREGLADARGNLMLTFGAIAARYRPRWLLWENVPGVLSSDDGRDFAQLLGLLTGRQVPVPADGWGNSGIIPGIADAYGIAWRVLDAQHVRTRRFRRAVPQRRRRVFVVGYLGDWRRAAAVLFDRESLRRDPPPRREAGQRPAPTISARPTGGGGLGTDFDLDGGLIANSGDVGYCLTASAQQSLDAETETLVLQVAPTLRGRGFDATDDGTGKGTPIIPVAHPLTAGMAASANRMPHEQGALIPVCFDSKGSQVQTDETGAAPTLRAMTHADSHQNGGGQLAVAYSIQAGALRENPDAGPDGVGVQEGHAYTLEARAEVQAVAFSHEPHKPVGVRQEIANGNATEADAGEILRGVRDALGEEAFSQWGLGILDMLQSPEILRSALHGRKLRPAPFTRRWVVDCALSRQEDRGAWAVQSLREAGGEGCASSGWEPSEQRAHELGAYLSELSQPGAQAERFMLDLWRASEGIGLLRKALSAVQEARRPSRGEGQPAQTTWKVRRLTPDECEFLQGMPRGMTNVPWRGKPFAPDGNRYKACGNSWALNAVEWIGERMVEVDGWTDEIPA